LHACIYKITTLFFFSKPFQSHEEEGLGEALKKGIPSLSYLPLRTSIQREGKLTINFHPSLASKEWLTFKGRILKPPKAFGWQIFSQERERECFLSSGKPHQNLRITKFISEQRDFGSRKRDIKYMGTTLVTDFNKVVRAACEISLAFQPEIFAYVRSLISIKASFLLRLKKRGIPRYLALAGIPLISEIEVVWQFLLKKLKI
jgi:hypothetical protein